MHNKSSISNSNNLIFNQHPQINNHIIDIDLLPNNNCIISNNINNNSNTPQISLSPKIQRSSSKLINDFNNDDYSIIKQIGEGSFGKIYSVEDKAHNKYTLT